MSPRAVAHTRAIGPRAGRSDREASGYAFPGCQQTVVSEYTHTSLSPQQQSALVEAFGLLEKTLHNGVSVGTVLLVSDERVAGMARWVAPAQATAEFLLETRVTCCAPAAQRLRPP